jgi:hypothetical protein
MGLVIQSFNFDSIKNNGDKNSNINNNNNNSRRNNNAASSSNQNNKTPLLDNIQAESIESDHE